jgi:colanic acid/amylovoran biosynthesis glycosyltransferase
MPSPMRIAYLTSVYARASDTFIRSEVIELRARGHTVHTFSIRREAADAKVSEEVRSEQANTDYILAHGPWPLARAFLAAGVSSPTRLARTLALAWRTRAPGLKAALLQLIYVVEAAYLAQRLRHLGVQVLHNHIAEASASVAMFASALSGVPFSLTVHGPGIFYHPLRWALPEKIARSSFTACITHFCKSQCMVFTPPQHWPRMHIVRCAVGRSFEGAAEVPIPDAPRLVFVGRLCAEKGLPLLVEAVARHVEAGGRCELVLVGDGPLRGEVEAIIERRQLQASIRIAGWMSSDGVRREIEQSRALVLPSFAEGLPVVIMEALALGRPVIATQIAGIPELVQDGVNGWLVPAGSVDGLVQAIGQATRADRAVLQAMGHEGQQRVARLHRLANEVDGLERLLATAAGAGLGTMNPQGAGRL